MDINFEQFIDLKEQPGLKIFVLVVGNEYSFLSQSTFWLYHLMVDSHVVRLTEDEFRILDYGKYPKVLLFDGQKEFAQFNGLPTYDKLASVIRRVKKGI